MKVKAKVKSMEQLVREFSVGHPTVRLQQLKYASKEVTITKADFNYYGKKKGKIRNRFQIAEDKDIFNWTDGMFENPPKIPAPVTISFKKEVNSYKKAVISASGVEIGCTTVALREVEQIYKALVAFNARVKAVAAPKTKAAAK